MKKIIIKKSILDCIIDNRKNIELSSISPDYWDDRLNRMKYLREKYKDIIPVDIIIKEQCENYLDLIESENYEMCNKYIFI